MDASQGLVRLEASRLVNQPDLVLLGAHRTSLSTVQRLPASIPAEPWGKDWSDVSVSEVAQLYTRQLLRHPESDPGGLHVQVEVVLGKTRHDGEYCFSLRGRATLTDNEIVGALSTMCFFFAYTAVRNENENIAFTCVLNFCLNIYYGTLYAYTPEVLPSAHRGTGNGIAIGLNRVMGIISAVIATYV